MNKKGFTLAELLIVVAIIAILVVIAIPIFNKQLEKSREATDIANLRAAKSLAAAQYNSGEVVFPGTASSDYVNYVYDLSKGKLVDWNSRYSVKGYGKGTTADGGTEPYFLYMHYAVYNFYVPATGYVDTQAKVNGRTVTVKAANADGNVKGKWIHVRIYYDGTIELNFSS